MSVVYDVLQSHNSFMVCTPFSNMIFHYTFRLFLEVKYCFMVNTWPLLNLSTECLVTLVLPSLQVELVLKKPKLWSCLFLHVPIIQTDEITASDTYHDRFISREPDYELFRINNFVLSDNM
jgi:hypothetical protein